MDWYYIQNGRQIGPVSESEFESLVHSGSITAESMVWRPGMADWLPYGTARTLDTFSTTEIVQQDVSGDSYFCAECGNMFAADEMVPYHNLRICATCKPLFFQRLREGAPLPTEMVYGGFWIRFLAKFVDSLILGSVNMLIQFGVGAFLTPPLRSGEPPPPLYFGLIFLMWFAQIGVGGFYTTWFVGKFAATPGKMACGLKIVTPDGGRVSYPRALGRYFAEMLSAIILYIGYLMAAFDDERRTLHDRICETRVVRK